jgi:hypothetical protein
VFLKTSSKTKPTVLLSVSMKSMSSFSVSQGKTVDKRPQCYHLALDTSFSLESCLEDSQAGI